MTRGGQKRREEVGRSGPAEAGRSGPAEAGRSGLEAGAAQRGRTVRAASHQRAEDLHSVHILPLPWIFFVKGVSAYAPENSENERVRATSR